MIDCRGDVLKQERALTVITVRRGDMGGLVQERKDSLLKLKGP